MTCTLTTRVCSSIQAPEPSARYPTPFGGCILQSYSATSFRQSQNRWLPRLRSRHTSHKYAHRYLSISLVLSSSVSQISVPYLSSQGKPDIHFSRCSGRNERLHCHDSQNASYLAGLTDVEKWGKNRVNFLHVSPSLLGELTAGAAAPRSTK